VHSLEEVIVDNVELGADMVRTKVTNESNSTSMEGAWPHILSLARPRFPLRHFPSILEPRLKHIDRTPPRVGVNERTEGGLGAGPDLVRRETRGLARSLIVQVDSMAEGKGPEISMIVLGPSKGSKDHDGTTGPNGALDGVFSDSIMVMATDATVFDTLALWDQFSGKFLGSINSIVRAVVTDLDTHRGGFSFKGKLCLHRFSPGEANLMDHGEFPAGGITEDGTTTVLLARDVVAASRELTAKKRWLVLVREDEVAGGKFVERQDSARVFDLSGAGLRCAFLFSKLTGGALGRNDSGRPHFDAEWPKETTTTQPLGVLEPEMAPLCMPKKQPLLQGSEVGCGLLGDAFEGKSLSSAHHIVEGTNDGKRGLVMIGDGDTVPISQF
jgi:hypothetical protein